MNQEGFSKNTSRNTMLRGSAMAITGAVLLTSFFVGRTKDVQEMIKVRFPKKGLEAVGYPIFRIMGMNYQLTLLKISGNDD